MAPSHLFPGLDHDISGVDYQDEEILGTASFPSATTPRTQCSGISAFSVHVVSGGVRSAERGVVGEAETRRSGQARLSRKTASNGKTGTYTNANELHFE